MDTKTVSAIVPNGLRPKTGGASERDDLVVGEFIGRLGLNPLARGDTDTEVNRPNAHLSSFVRLQERVDRAAPVVVPRHVREVARLEVGVELPVHACQHVPVERGSYAG